MPVIPSITRPSYVIIARSRRRSIKCRRRNLALPFVHVLAEDLRCHWEALCALKQSGAEHNRVGAHNRLMMVYVGRAVRAVQAVSRIA